MDAVATQSCAWLPCAKEFAPSKRWQKFCSDKCRIDHANARRKAAMEMLGTNPIPMLAATAGST